MFRQVTKAILGTHLRYPIAFSATYPQPCRSLHRVNIGWVGRSNMRLQFLRALCVVACPLVLAGLPSTEEVRLEITLNGSKVGENVYVSGPDGSFTSTT